VSSGRACESGMSDKVLGADSDLAQECGSREDLSWAVVVYVVNQWAMYTPLLTLYMIRRSLQ